MKFSVKSLLLIITLAAFFLAGWIGHERFGESFETWMRGKVEPDAMAVATLHVPIKVEGIVTRYNDGFVAISLGSDDGIQVGATVEIYRGNKSIGRSVVTVCERNRSAARILEEF